MSGEAPRVSLLPITLTVHQVIAPAKKQEEISKVTSPTAQQTAAAAVEKHESPQQQQPAAREPNLSQDLHESPGSPKGPPQDPPATESREYSSGFLFGTLSAQVLGLAGGLVAGLLLQVALVVLVLHRCRQWFAQHLRVEIVGLPATSNPGLPGANMAQPIPPSPEQVSLAHSELPLEPQPESGEVNPGPAERFELRSIYQEELRMKQEAARLQEEEIIRRMVEQNLQLREQIEQWTDEAA